jgi:uncharacterized protein
VLKLPRQVRVAFDEADVVHTEIPMNSDTQLEAAQRALLPDPRTLQDVLPPDLWKDLETYLASRNVPLAAFSRLKVWAVASTLPLLGWLERLQRQEPLDQYLASQARARGARLGALETVASQVAALESLGPEGEIELLRDTLGQLKAAARRGVDPTEELLEVYLRGDLDDLESVAFDAGTLDAKRRAQLMDALIYTRNEDMVRGIREALAREPTASHFFAVGALHFWGERGIVALLRAQGVSVVRAGGESRTSAPPAREPSAIR